MSKYFRYEIKNIEPLRIADDSSSQMGQTRTLRYIPGTTIRGLVINTLARENKLEEVKRALFSDRIRFLNAYPIAFFDDGQDELIPSIKGFYEDKKQTEGKKQILNVVSSGDVPDGMKRAGLGDFVSLHDSVADYYKVSVGSDLKIKIGADERDEQSVFRNEYISAGHTFAGYIAIEDESVNELIESVFKGTIILGNGRSSGLGKCAIKNSGFTKRMPFDDYLLKNNQERSVYMMLLSNTVMRNHETGEYCGLDLKELELKLDVRNLRIERCATASVDVRGYNRIWGVKTPSITMYDKGSVFRLTADDIFKAEKMDALANQGIGVRRNEGFGRIIFLNNYDQIQFKQSGAGKIVKNSFSIKEQAEDKDVLRIAARGYYRNLFRTCKLRYLNDNPLDRGGVSSSKLGNIEAYTAAYRFDFRQAKSVLDKYIEHTDRKKTNQRIHKDTQPQWSSIGDFIQCVIMESRADFEERIGVVTKEKQTVMGIPKDELFTEDEYGKMKLELLTDLIRYDNKEEK